MCSPEGSGGTERRSLGTSHADSEGAVEPASMHRGGKVEVCSELY